MSEEQQVQAPSVGDLIDQIAAGNYNASSDLFNELIHSKMEVALDAEKVSVAQDIYNTIDDDEEEDDEELFDLEDDDEEEYLFDEDDEEELIDEEDDD